jgi:hypothetical protein
MFAVPITLPSVLLNVTMPLVARLASESRHVATIVDWVLAPPLFKTWIEVGVADKVIEPRLPWSLGRNDTVTVAVFPPALAVTVHGPAADPAVSGAIA